MIYLTTTKGNNELTENLKKKKRNKNIFNNIYFEYTFFIFIMWIFWIIIKIKNNKSLLIDKQNEITYIFIYRYY